LASDFHTAVSQAPAISRSSTSAWLAIVESIPQTHTHPLRELHFTQAFDKFVKTLSDHTVFHDDYLRTDQPAAAPTPAAVALHQANLDDPRTKAKIHRRQFQRSLRLRTTHHQPMWSHRQLLIPVHLGRFASTS
jgi:hypothetical protein